MLVFLASSLAITLYTSGHIVVWSILLLNTGFMFMDKWTCIVFTLGFKKVNFIKTSISWHLQYNPAYINNSQVKTCDTWLSKKHNYEFSLPDVWSSGISQSFVSKQAFSGQTCGPKLLQQSSFQNLSTSLGLALITPGNTKPEREEPSATTVHTNTDTPDRRRLCMWVIREQQSASSCPFSFPFLPLCVSL